MASHAPPNAPPSPVTVNVHWPLYSIYPAAAAIFWLNYLYLTPWLSNKRVQEYRDVWLPAKRMSWGQNVNYLLHSVLLVFGLVGELLSDEADELRDAGLRPHYSAFAYSTVCVSLGYMSFTLPWSFNVWFRLKRRDMGTSQGLIVHHCCVVVAELVYLLTQTSPWYGALSLVLFEISNLNAAPHLLMTQLDYRGAAHFLNGIAFLVTYTGSRIIGCTVLGAFYLRDYILLDSSDPALWGSVACSLAAFAVLMGLSYYWFYRDVVTVTHYELQQYFGRDYCSKCCPGPIIKLIAICRRGATRSSATSSSAGSCRAVVAESGAASA